MGRLSSNHKKYLSKNPIKLLLIEKFMATILDSIAQVKPAAILEVGCGEGFMTGLIRENFPDIRLEALDLSANAIEIARAKTPDVPFHCGSVEQLDFGDAEFDLVLCAEVLEHINGIDKAMLELCRVSKQHVILSVPHEPYFRVMNFMAFNHFLSMGNPPGHINHWSKGKFQKAVSPYMDIQTTHSPFPWTVIVGSKKADKGGGQ